MAQRRSNALFIIINVVISLAVALLVITVYSSNQTEETPRARPTIVLVVTATSDPNQPLPAAALQGTLDAQAGTVVALERNLESANAALAQAANSDSQATPEVSSGNQPIAQANTGSNPQASDPDLPTIDPNLIPALPTRRSGAGGGGDSAIAQAAITATPADGCQRYFVQSGDTASTIAARFEVDLSELFVLNGINDRTVLQIGDELLVPSPTCQQEVPPTETPTAQPTFNLTIVAPTATLAVVNEDSQVQIVQILNAGDITTEQVEIQNLGGELNLRGWTLSDSQGNLFTFPEVRLVPGSVIRVSSRVGTNTPGFLYWNQNQAIWQQSETATLTDAEGVVQSLFTPQTQIINFGPTATP
jgi:LysM repeat protein